jgi:hypothetical protein
LILKSLPAQAKMGHFAVDSQLWIPLIPLLNILLEAFSEVGRVSDIVLAPGKHFEANIVAFLMEEELKFPAASRDALRDAIQDAITYLELSKAQVS